MPGHTDKKKMDMKKMNMKKMDMKKMNVPNYAKGGMVEKTGLAKVHKGEMVLTKAQAKQLKKMFD